MGSEMCIRDSPSSPELSRAPALGWLAVDTIAGRSSKGAYNYKNTHSRGKLGAKTARGYAVGLGQITVWDRRGLLIYLEGASSRRCRGHHILSITPADCIVRGSVGLAGS